MPSKNPEVIKKCRDAWYRANKDRQIARQTERKRESRIWLWNHKSTLSCSDCKISFRGREELCDFHHLDPSLKDGSVHDILESSIQAAMAEMEKCVPLCANCHRTRHRDKYSGAAQRIVTGSSDGRAAQMFEDEAA